MATAVSAHPTPHEEEPAPQIVLLDPSQVERDEQNARETDTEPDAELIASVKEIGVEEAISVRPRPDGTYGAFKGWRRTQAQKIANDSAEADGRPVRRIKAHVREDLVGRDGWTRFLSLVENKHRAGMSARDILKSQELSLINMSEVERRQATRALGVGRNAARQARAAQKLDDATLRRATAGGMDLDQTAQLAEVEHVQGAERRLLRALERDHEEGGGRGHWDQEMALIKAEQADDDARIKAEEGLKTANIPLLGQPRYGQKDTSKPLVELTTGLGNPLMENNHKNCPGHSARLDPEHQPVWHCSDPAAYGHKVRPQPKKRRTEQDELRAEERRRVIACNRAWKAAAGPRQDFVARLVRRKTLPDAARVFAQEIVLTLPYFYSSWTDKRESESVARFLGIKEPEHADLTETAVQLPKARVVNALFAHVAAACEHYIRDPKTWSNLNERQARYLLLLEALGQEDSGSYRLSEVETEAVAPHRPDTAA
ncbi:ParB/RepB/Spo0J family partition protein [Streptomyces sp. PA5.6]|uniref:ParB/RepB/Spo0J family partition protein n=1 Tax=Streptomyces sp. PA5.6 TaxID=3035651 RepID=UPI0039049980